ncbi:chemotaxis-specific protein-glutamate methyltransferase CheB [Azospirillum sp.]|uniref:chemotaxis-specific protein-glutamate methyltransferase CheB n=1 Tax=Azospirillum sp. TaxID=34012 RepID=UPI002D5827F3|nr:chemotaxis-specific protein-glutamate methyltransferase CheB [Azospirillum sp.]HYD64972.1 chemotaxis-specific protein-glutamate methyltransferase CheB [Azospirillum sp.]
MSVQRKVRVLVVEDSPVVQELLVHTISQDPRLEVAAVAPTAEAALRLMAKVKPDVVSLDIRLPGMNGLEATKRIMREHPLPIVVVAADVHGGDMNISMNALRAGALSVVEKPGSLSRADYAAVARHLCSQLFAMSQVKVIRQRFAADPPAPKRMAAPLPLAADAPRRFEVLALVASTGGPNALVKVLAGLSAGFPLPVLVVQHIGAAFVEGFASWLGTVCPMPVEVAEHGAQPRPGRVYVAPGDTHLEAGRAVLRLTKESPVCGQRPSGDVLFRSLANTFGPAAIGVLLTGMGEDGARGLLAMREAGAYTIAEHASTAVIHGMPGEAVKLGAATEELPLPRVAPRLLDLLASKGGGR